jgi:5'-nucleotidase
VTFGESFTLQPFGNSLVVLELSAQEIKDLLEQQFPGCSGQTSLHVLQLSRGLAERWQAAASGCHHIMDVRLTRDGVTETIVAQGAVAGTQSPYRVTVNSYLASGGDGFSVLAHAARARGGAQDVDALAAYLSRFEPPHAPYDPRAAEHAATPRITRIP